MTRLLALILILAACAADEGVPEEASTTSMSAPGSSTVPESASPPTTSPDTSLPSIAPTPEAETPRGVFVDSSVVDAALEQAAEETGISPGDFDIELAMQVAWNDGSLGCPEPDQAYIQALVDGFWVVLTHDGETFDYRSTMEQGFKRCVDGLPPAETYVDR